VGGGVGAAAGGTKGAVVGAAVGAAAGGAVGNYLDKQAQELAKVAPTQRLDDGVLVNLKNDLLFEFDSAELTPRAYEQLTSVGKILAKYPEDRIRVSGHTDSRGPASYNEELSERRADAVRDVLRSQGVRESQMFVEGYGEAKPVAGNGNAAGRQRNRRVELFIDVPRSA
jgi:outer membrane protein OmpA-like peptidoglycan-associated protein